MLLLLELLGVAAVIGGAGLIHPGLGLLLAGALVVAVVEVRGRS